MKATRLIKENLRRAGAFLLLLCVLLPVLCACDDGKTSETPTDTASGASSVTVNGIALEQYEIRYAWRDANKERDQAKEIQKAIKSAFGVTLKVGEDTDESGQYLIMVGDRDNGAVTSKTMQLTENDYALTAEGDCVYMLAKTSYGMEQAVGQFLLRVSAATESKTISIAKGSVQSYEGHIVNTMTFNIRCWSPTQEHLGRIVSTVKNANYPDTIGFQEMGKSGSWVWIDKLMAVSDLSSVYAYVGEDRGDGTGERAAIFYRKDKFRLIESGTKWMYGNEALGSDTPGRVNIPHSTEHGDYYRVYSYVLLERISDGVRFAHLNTHLDTVSYYADTATGLQVQTQQLSYALAMAKKLRDENNNCTVVFTGDFNTKSTSSSFKSITAAGFEWTEQITKKKVGMQVNDTYNGEKEPLTICKDIDHIFLWDDNAYCICYTICDKKIAYKGQEDYASDHLARYATYVVD